MTKDVVRIYQGVENFDTKNLVVGLFQRLFFKFFNLIVELTQIVADKVHYK